MEKLRARINWLLVLVYLLMMAGASALGVFFAVEFGLHPALTSMFVFGAATVIPFALYVRDRGTGWLVASAVGLAGALVALSVFLGVEGVLHPALLGALYAFALAAIILFFLDRTRDVRRARRGEPSPAERDVPVGR